MTDCEPMVNRWTIRCALPDDRDTGGPVRQFGYAVQMDAPSAAGRSGAPGLGPALTAIPRRETPSAEVTRRLLDYLLSGDIHVGNKIPPERQLAQALNVGRSAVREAIKSLSLLGLLDVRQGDGTYLTGSSSDLLPRVIEWGLLLGERRVHDLVEARTNLEITVAGLAAERRTDEQVARLRELIGAMEKAADDIATYVDADLSLHLTIAAA